MANNNIIYNCYVNDFGAVYKGLLGIQMHVSKFYSEYDEEMGILVKKEEITVDEITADTFADGLLEPGDIIKSVTLIGKTVDIYRRHHLSDILFDFRIGENVTITVIRDGEEVTLNKVIGETHFIEC